MVEYNLQNYDFKKAVQQIINDEFKPLFLSDAFVQSGKNKYIREKDGLVQMIFFRIEKDRLLAFANLFPIYFPADYFMNYGIEITGSTGVKLLGGKYFTTIYEPEYLDKAIQLEHYNSKHKANMQKLFLSVKEGVLAEMDRINSLDKFIEMFDQSDPIFFGNEFDNTLRRTDTHLYNIYVYSCLKKHFQKGVQDLTHLQSLIQNNDLAYCKDMFYCIDLLLVPEKEKRELTYEKFCENYEYLCNMRRRKLKLIK